ncbi:MAG: PAS domain-containing protein [Spirochaetes bacterium]|nr:PAS domain-containing protein [Spirochaetota bacterium]
MTFLFTPYAIALFAASAVSAFIAILAWYRRSIPGGGFFTLMMCAVVIWSFMAALEAGSVGLADKLLFSQLGYIGTTTTAPFFLLFVLRYSNREYPVRAVLVVALMAVPLVTLALAFTNPLHGLVWSRIVPDPRPGTNMAIYSHGPWYWVALAYYFALVFSGAVMLVRTALRSAALYVSQTVVLLAGLLVPWIGALIYLLPVNPFPGLDLVPIGFAFTGVLLLFGMTRYRLFDLVPVARDIVVEKMVDGLVVLDGADRILDMNSSARVMLGLASSVVGMPAAQALGALGGKLAEVGAGPDARAEIALPGESPRSFDLRVSPLAGRRGKPAGRLLLIRDVTERRKIELEREKLIGELREAIADIRTLRGLLPICASCKKIRDDGGYWQNLEQYVTAHSEAQFSHGFCPDCMKKLYPEYVDPETGNTRR